MHIPRHTQALSKVLRNWWFKGIRVQILSLHGNSFQNSPASDSTCLGGLMPTLICLPTSPSHKRASPTSQRKSIPFTDQEHYCGTLPSNRKSGQETIQNTGVGKISFCPRDRTFTTLTPFILGRYEHLTNLVFLFTKKKNLFISNHKNILKDPILVHCLLLIIIMIN